MKQEKISIFWFRRDLRLEDNIALARALESGLPVLPVFIFDTQIIDELPDDDARISFIYKHLQSIHRQLGSLNSALHVFRPKYNGIAWNNSEDDFGRWCWGETGYPMVDAGMRQLFQIKKSALYQQDWTCPIWDQVCTP